MGSTELASAYVTAIVRPQALQRIWGASKAGLSWTVPPQAQRKDSQPVPVRWNWSGVRGITGGTADVAGI